MSKPTDYFRGMRQISAIMTLILERVFLQAPKIVQPLISPLIVRKIEKKTNMRPFLFYIGMCLARGKVITINTLTEVDRTLISELTAALEMENISTYYINHFLDKKGDIRDEIDAKNRVLAGLYCREAAESILENSRILSEAQKSFTISTIRQINEDITVAQTMDINELTFEKIADFPNQEVYEQAYFQRCRMISGQFYGRCVELGIRLGSEQTDTEACRLMTELYTRMSTLGQFGNDIGDLAPPEAHSGTVEKNYYKDYGSDFLNGRLTYPNYLLLKRVNASDRKKINEIKRSGFTPDSLKTFLNILSKYHVIEDAYQRLLSAWKQEKKTLVLPKGELRSLVSSSLIIFKSNKLLKAARSAAK